MHAHASTTPRNDHAEVTLNPLAAMLLAFLANVEYLLDGVTIDRFGIHHVGRSKPTWTAIDGTLRKRDKMSDWKAKAIAKRSLHGILDPLILKATVGIPCCDDLPRASRRVNALLGLLSFTSSFHGVAEETDHEIREQAVHVFVAAEIVERREERNAA